MEPYGKLINFFLELLSQLHVQAFKQPYISYISYKIPIFLLKPYNPYILS